MLDIMVIGTSGLLWSQEQSTQEANIQVMMTWQKLTASYESSLNDKQHIILTMRMTTKTLILSRLFLHDAPRIQMRVDRESGRRLSGARTQQLRTRSS
jgi:hypothetical protein